MVDIQIRTTSLHTYNDEIVLIPNSQVFTNAVINYTRLGRRRYAVAFDTSLSADADLVQRESLRAVQENADVATDPAPFVRVKSVDRRFLKPCCKSNKTFTMPGCQLQPLRLPQSCITPYLIPAVRLRSNPRQRAKLSSGGDGGSCGTEAATVRAKAFNEWKEIGADVFKMRMDFGPGYRAYFAKQGKVVVILLGGGQKSSQQKDITDAKR